MGQRNWWLIFLLILIGVGGAAEFTRTQPKVYESSTSVLVQPTGGGQDTNVVGGRTKGDINLDTEAQLVQSTAVAADAATLLRSTASAESLAANVSVEVPANTSVLVIMYAAADPRAAQAGSHAFAESYLRNREETARADLTGQIATLDAKVKELNNALATINGRLAQVKGDSQERPNLESQRSTVANQVNTLASRLNQLATTTVSAGKIIRDAELPGSPAKPNRTLNLASGAMAGLVLGVGAALLRERLDKRIRRAAELPRRADVAVLAAIPARVRPRLDDIFAPFGTGGRIFNRLRNEILASVPPPPTGDIVSSLNGQIVVVAGASRGAASTVVAANLAAAFARTGGETVLVCAHLPDSLVETASVNRMLGVRAVPGLSDVLAGRVPLRNATQRAPRHPFLRVVTTGGTASAGGLLQSQALRETLATLRSRAAYIVIEAPSTATSADAQSLASLADAAIIAVELRRTRYAEVSDAADQLRRVGTPMLGTVVLPRLGASRATGQPAIELAPVTIPRAVLASPEAPEAPEALSAPAAPAPGDSASDADDDVTTILDSLDRLDSRLDRLDATTAEDETVVIGRLPSKPTPGGAATDPPALTPAKRRPKAGRANGNDSAHTTVLKRQ